MSLAERELINRITHRSISATHGPRHFMSSCKELVFPEADEKILSIALCWT